MSLYRRRASFRQPEIPFLPYCLDDLLAHVRNEHFPLQQRPVEVFLLRQSTLACIDVRDERAVITIHAVLNRAQVPVEVMAYILKHELLHIEVPPRAVDGKTRMHPPEFLEREFAIAPEYSLTWNWIWLNLYSCLRSDEHKECTYVRRNWSSFTGARHLSLDEVKKMMNDWQTPVL